MKPIQSVSTHDAQALAAAYTTAGYRRVSNKHQMIARIDRVDWQVVIKEKSNAFLLLSQGAAADQYRRCFSEDTISLPSDQIDVFRLIPSSGHDPIGFVHPNGTEDPGYEVTLTPKAGSAAVGSAAVGSVAAGSVAAVGS